MRLEDLILSKNRLKGEGGNFGHSKDGRKNSRVTYKNGSVEGALWLTVITRSLPLIKKSLTIGARERDREGGR